MTLADGTRVQVFTRPASSGGQRTNGPDAVLVRLDTRAWMLVLRSGYRSTHKTRRALETCATWHEVPLAIEAVGVVS